MWHMLGWKHMALNCDHCCRGELPGYLASAEAGLQPALRYFNLRGTSLRSGYSIVNSSGSVLPPWLELK